MVDELEKESLNSSVSKELSLGAQMKDHIEIK